MLSQWVNRGREVLSIEIEALEAIKNQLDDSFAQAVILLGACQGRVAVTGIGKSGLVGRKLAATLSSTGTPAFFLHPVEGAHGDLGAIREGDVVIAISYSGKSEELNSILPALRSLGAKIIALTGGLQSPMAQLADVVINSKIPREACPMNLAPTSSTTATLALGDALAVCLIDMKAFTANDFKRFHPAGALGQRLSLSIADVMHTVDIPLLHQQTATAQAVAALDKGGFGAVILIDDEQKLAGILTDGDVRRAFCQQTFTPDAPVSTIMTRTPRRALGTQSAAEIMDIMEQKTITVLPVVDDNEEVVGIVHIHDLLGKGKVKFAG